MTKLFSVALVSVTVLLISSLANGFNVSPSRAYYSTQNDVLTLECGGQTFNNFTVITYFANDQKTPFYNSSLKVQQTNWVKGADKANKTITLNTKVITTGLSNLYCMSNKTTSTNRVTVPYIEGPRFAYTPKAFELKKNYTFTCNGFMAPKAVAMSIDFMVNTTTVIGTLNNGVLTNTGKVSGIYVSAVKGANSSISFSPTFANNSGTYWCRFQFTIPGNAMTQLSSLDSWKTNGVETLASQFLMIAAGFLTVFFANIHY